MKKFLFIILTTISMSSVAQESITDKDYIFSPNGFIVKEYQHPDGSGVSRGLYTADGKTFVKILFSSNKSLNFYVAPGTEIIAERSILLYGFLKRPVVKIPRSVKYISPKAFVKDDMYFFDLQIYDEIFHTSQDNNEAFLSTNDNIKKLTTSTSK